MNSNVEILDAPVGLQTPVVENAFTTWSLDGAHSSAGFSVRHMMITNVRGDFRDLSGTLQLDRENLDQSSVNITINPASIETHEPARDAHLKSADFFDVEKYPEVKFHSTQWSHKSGDELLVKGDLTLRGVTKEVMLTVEGPTQEITDPYGNKKIGFSASTKINRKDFGLGWNVVLEAGGFAVSEDVKITIEAQFVKQ